MLFITALEAIKIKVTPREGVHANVEYKITFTFQEERSWPKIQIDSPIFDKIKTSQLKKNIGFGGAEHKGICIKDLSYGYNYYQNFRTLCANKWENYIYLVIITFNNIQDFEKGNGFKSTYKQILKLT